MIAGLQEPTDGRVDPDRGRDVTDVPAERRPVNTVFQHYALFPHLDVFENVAFGLRERRRPAQRDRANASATCSTLVGLADRGRATDPRAVRRPAAARRARRALILEPAVLLLDEPLGALDLKLRRQMQIVLKQVQSRVGITFLYVTHDQEEAFAMSDRVGVMGERGPDAGRHPAGDLPATGQPVRRGLRRCVEPPARQRRRWHGGPATRSG